MSETIIIQQPLVQTISIDGTQVVATDNSNVQVVTEGIQGPAGAGVSGFTNGSVAFGAAGTITQDNANFFWDDTNNRLNIGQNTGYTSKVGIKCASTTEKGLTIQAAASATADVFQFQNAAGQTGASIALQPAFLGGENNWRINIGVPSSRLLSAENSTPGSLFGISGDFSIGYVFSTLQGGSGLLFAGNDSGIPPINGDTLGAIGFLGNPTTTELGGPFAIACSVSGGNWSNTSTPTMLTFFTCPVGADLEVPAFVITDAGTIVTNPNQLSSGTFIVQGSTDINLLQVNATTDTVQIGNNSTVGNSKFYVHGVAGVRAGTSAIAAKVGGTIIDHATDYQSVGTTATNLWSSGGDSILANILANDNDKIEFYEMGTFSATTTATKRIKKFFGATQIFDSGSLTSTAAGTWEMRGLIIRESSSVVRCSVSMFTTGISTLIARPQYTRITGLTLTADNAFNTSVQAGGTGTANGDITATLSTTQYYPAA